MMRILLTCALAGATALAQTGAGSQTAPAQNAKPSAGTPQPQGPTADQLPPDTVVITVHGLCPGKKPGDPSNSDACVTRITKEQYDRIVKATTTTPLNKVANRTFAENYVQILTLATAAEQAGIDQDPMFQEQFKVVRARALADAYRQSVTQKSNPTPEALEAYYEQNLSKYERLQLDKVYIPLRNSTLPKEQQEDFAQKARAVATEMRERAVKGEDTAKLQIAAYDRLALLSPPKTDLGYKPKNAFAPDLAQRLWALKLGEVSGMETEPSGLAFYKLKARTAIPLSALQEGLTRELSAKGVQAAIQGVLGGVKTDFNEQFFTNRPAGTPPKPLQMRRPAPDSTPSAPKKDEPK